MLDDIRIDDHGIFKNLFRKVDLGAGFEIYLNPVAERIVLTAVVEVAAEVQADDLELRIQLGKFSCTAAPDIDDVLAIVLARQRRGERIDIRLPDRTIVVDISIVFWLGTCPIARLDEKAFCSHDNSYKKDLEKGCPISEAASTAHKLNKLRL